MEDENTFLYVAEDDKGLGHYGAIVLTAESTIVSGFEAQSLPEEEAAEREVRLPRDVHE